VKSLFSVHQLLDSVWRGVPGEHKNKASKECLVAALDKMADAASLPHHGAVKQVTSPDGTAPSHSNPTTHLKFGANKRGFFQSERTS
jgi:hypothetical protein